TARSHLLTSFDSDRWEERISYTSEINLKQHYIWKTSIDIQA
ncbi:hypothetical protein FOPG_20032, partial [Fusarium oxysporum f. sp. conglutinans race 2 54008]